MTKFLSEDWEWKGNYSKKYCEYLAINFPEEFKVVPMENGPGLQ